MANDIQVPVKLPIPHGIARGPVLSARAGQGWYRILHALNTGFEQWRGPLVNAAQIEETSTTPDYYYRVRVPGDGGGLASEPAYLAGCATVPVLLGSLTLRAVAASTSTLAFVAGDTEAWRISGTDLDIDDGVEYEDITVDLSAAGGGATLHSVSIWYKRAKTTLAKGVKTCGFAPYTITAGTQQQVGPNVHVSAQTLYDCHDNLINIWEQRVGEVVQQAWPSNAGFASALGSVSDMTMFVAAAPRDVTEARIWVRLEENTLIGADPLARLIIDVLDHKLNVIDSGFVIGTGAVSWRGPIDLSVSQGPNLFKVSGRSISLYSICGWWKDRAYY